MKIEGTLYLHIVKGRRTKDSWDGLFKQQSPLIYAWRKVNGDGIDDWSWSYVWPKEDGSGEGRLGKGWKRVPVWREYPGGIKQWISDLHECKIFPRHVRALDEVFPESLPVERRVDEVESWKRQVVAQELHVARAVEEMSIVADADHLHIDALFPQHSSSCHSYSGCQFLDVCWGGVAAEPGELYTIRSANHPEGEDEENG